MREDKFGKKGLTFDDVLLVPAHSEVLPKEVDISTRLTRNITLNIPVMSAGMDTVTESDMAIAMAREGGIGVIHKNMSIDEQCKEVEKVKRSEHGVIVDPVYLNPDNTLSDADDLMVKYDISGIPVTVDGKLVGIITNRDMRFETDLSRPISEIMTSEGLITAPENTKLEEAKRILQEHRIEKLPLIDKDGYLKGLITIKDIEKMRKYPNSSKDKDGRLLAAAAVGVTPNVLERAEALLAGTDESPGEIIIYQGKNYKLYRGMGSLGAMQQGSKDRYFQQDAKKLVPEGIEGRIPYKGHVSDVLFQLIGGLRAAMGYCGTPDIPAMNENTRFIEITGAGLRESHPHDVSITKESPNYSAK